MAVSNEVGMGIVPVGALARSYRDVIGRVNAIWAEAADERCSQSRGAAATGTRVSAVLERAVAAVRSPTPPRARGPGRLDEDEAARFAGRARAAGRAHRGHPAHAPPGVRHARRRRLRRRSRRGVRGRQRLPVIGYRQMVANYAAGGAAVCVLARRAGARLVVVDCGVAEPLPVAGRARPQARRRHGEHAARPRDVARARRSGARDGHRAGRRAAGRAGCVALGEMGIGNSTAAAAL